jgi:hypothetical protein
LRTVCLVWRVDLIEPESLVMLKRILEAGMS